MISQRLALADLLPQLGDVEVLDLVDGQHPSYPGLTFDYAATLKDGRRLAIEVTQIIVPEFARTSGSGRKFGEELVRLLDAQGAPGRWHITLNPTLDVRRLDRQAWVGAMILMSRDSRAELDGCEIVRHPVDRLQPDRDWRLPRVQVGTTYLTAELNVRAREMFGYAIESNRKKLEDAGRAGFQTHLVAWYDGVVVTKDWHLEVSTRLSDAAHPQRIWVVPWGTPPHALR